MIRPVSHVAVVIPVHDEEELLGACLASVDVSLGALRADRADLTTSVVVVLDSCTDDSAAVVAAGLAVDVVVTDVSRVGAARAAGVRRVLGERAPSREVWLANTDADTVVPAHWLSRQVELADRGADVVIGTVAPALAYDSRRGRAWWATHHLGEDHPHLHGANLGVRASAYLAVGGFPDLACHEDVRLVASLRESGAVCVATDTTRVRTSARLVGRTPGGFAGFLASLALPGP